MVEHSVTVRVFVTAAVERADKVRRRVVSCCGCIALS